MDDQTKNGTSLLQAKDAARLPADDRKFLNTFLTYANLVIERQSAMGNFGKMFKGDRDIPEAAGYNINRQFADYSAKYSLQGVAKRVVEAPGESTWQEPPTLTDGDDEKTPFIEQWKKLVNFSQNDFNQITDQKSIWHYLRRIDYLSGVGRYGCLVLGVNDGADDFEQPLVKRGAKTLADFLYLAPYDEGNIKVAELGDNPNDKRYNLPAMYNLTASEEVLNLIQSRVGTGTEEGVKIHWTRVIHIAEFLGNNEIFGAPRLEPVYDLLDDLLKVTAATGESAWQMMTKGLIASTRDGFHLPDDTTNIRDAMEKFMHEQMRVLELQGMDVTLTDGAIVDPTGVIKSIISLVSATTGIPQRILLGSEAGHLASSQDEKNWSQRIMSRQNNFAEALILRPLINRLIYVGLLPEPTNGQYGVKWPNQLLLTDLEKAQKSSAEMTALASGVGPDKLPLVTFLKVVLSWPDDVVKQMLLDKRLERTMALIDFPPPPL